MLIGFDGKGLIGPLVEVPATDGPAMQMPTPDVRRGKPLHERPQLTIGGQRGDSGVRPALGDSGVLATGSDRHYAL